VSIYWAHGWLNTPEVKWVRKKKTKHSAQYTFAQTISQALLPSEGLVPRLCCPRTMLLRGHLVLGPSVLGTAGTLNSNTCTPALPPILSLSDMDLVLSQQLFHSVCRGLSCISTPLSSVESMPNPHTI